MNFHYPRDDLLHTNTVPTIIIQTLLAVKIITVNNEKIKHIKKKIYLQKFLIHEQTSGQNLISDQNIQQNCTATRYCKDEEIFQILNKYWLPFKKNYLPFIQAGRVRKQINTISHQQKVRQKSQGLQIDRFLLRVQEDSTLYRNQQTLMIILHYIISLTLPFIDQYPNIIIRQYILKQEMHKHNSTDNELDDSEYQTDKASVQLKLLKIKSVSRQYKHQFRKQIFGDHYNHSKVNLNKQKKYLLQEEKNTEIQRSNRMLLEKIQQIAKRSIPFSQRKRIFTQHQDQGQRQESQQNKALIKQLKSTDSEHYSQNNLTKIGEKSKNTKVYKKNLFKVSKQIENKLYQVSAQLQNNKYILSLSNNKQTQYIKISCRHYRSIYKQILQCNHLNILPFLQIKHGQFTLCGIDKKLIIIEQISSSKSLLPKIFSKELSQSKINKEI